jgi:ribosomal protein L7/L12
MFDYTKDLRRLLAEGNTLDHSLAALRAKGVSIIASMYAVKKVRDCDLSEAKQIVHFSPAWADSREEHDKFHAELEELVKKIEEQGSAGNGP